MQQTETYKLNKPEMSDLMSLAPLNENMDKLETALLAKTAETRTDGLEQRIVTLEGHHAVGGSYVGTGGTRTIELGFTPQVVFLYLSNTRFCMICPGDGERTCGITEGGFWVNNAQSSYAYNFEGSNYMFLAIG